MKKQTSSRSSEDRKHLAGILKYKSSCRTSKTRRVSQSSGISYRSSISFTTIDYTEDSLRGLYRKEILHRLSIYGNSPAVRQLASIGNHSL